MTKDKLCTLCNNKTKWLPKLLAIIFDNTIYLKTDDSIFCAVENFNHAVQQAVWNATPTGSNLDINIEY
jgi:hypothetical protein